MEREKDLHIVTVDPRLDQIVNENAYETRLK